MKRLSLIMLLLGPPARAQPIACAKMPVEVWVALPQASAGAARVGAARVGLGDLSGMGPDCQAPPRAEPVTDILRGAPAPKGLLRGDGPRDVLHMVRDSQVTIQARPP